MDDSLPDDIEQLKALLREQHAGMKKQQSRLHQYAGQVAGYGLEINRLKAQLDKLWRVLFGLSSEKSRNKLENKILRAEKRLSELGTRLEVARNCLNDNEPVPDVPADIVTAQKTTPEKPARNASRKPLPADLPRETQPLLPADSVCPSCGGELKVMGEIISEQLEITNTAFKVIETVQPEPGMPLVRRYRTGTTPGQTSRRQSCGQQPAGPYPGRKIRGAYAVVPTV